MGAEDGRGETELVGVSERVHCVLSLPVAEQGAEAAGVDVVVLRTGGAAERRERYGAAPVGYCDGYSEWGGWAS